MARRDDPECVSGRPTHCSERRIVPTPPAVPPTTRLPSAASMAARRKSFGASAVIGVSAALFTGGKANARCHDPRARKGVSRPVTPEVMSQRMLEPGPNASLQLPICLATEMSWILFRVLDPPRIEPDCGWDGLEVDPTGWPKRVPIPHRAGSPAGPRAAARAALGISTKRGVRRIR